MKPGVLFIQNRPHRAGAQTCLARMLGEPVLRQWNPIVLCSKSGWLTDECDRMEIPFLVETFPSSRSLGSRLIRNRAFSKRALGKVRALGIEPDIVFANDHWEGLLGVELGRESKAKTAILLRSSGMTERDYKKYSCGSYQCIATIGDALNKRVQGWDPTNSVHKVYDGIMPNEFRDPRPKPDSCPSRVLVIGSALDSKGWADLAEAVWHLQKDGDFDWRFDFTGDEPNPVVNDMQLGRLQEGTCTFLGRRENFRELVRSYDLVINPTWHETFGMAAVEVLAAGVPLLSTRTGVMGRIQPEGPMLVAPGRSDELAEAMSNLEKNWRSLDFDVAGCQERIQRQFLVEATAQRWDGLFEELLK